jgi:hypothetical protein
MSSAPRARCSNALLRHTDEFPVVCQFDDRVSCLMTIHKRKGELAGQVISLSDQLRAYSTSQ